MQTGWTGLFCSFQPFILFNPGQEGNKGGDYLYSQKPSSAGSSSDSIGQAFWEAFPSANGGADGSDRTTYFFTYCLPGLEDLPSIPKVFEKYVEALPQYQGVSLEQLKVQRALCVAWHGYSLFPTGHHDIWFLSFSFGFAFTSVFFGALQTRAQPKTGFPARFRVHRCRVHHFAYRPRRASWPIESLPCKHLSTASCKWAMPPAFNRPSPSADSARCVDTCHAWRLRSRKPWNRTC